VQVALVGFPRAVALLLREKPVTRPGDDVRVHLVDLRHVEKLLHAPRGQHLVRGRVAEPGKPAAVDLVGKQALIPGVDKALGLHLDFRVDLFGRLHVLHYKDIWISHRTRLFEATERHLQHAVETVHHLREHAGIDAHENLARARHGIGGDRNDTGHVGVEPVAERHFLFLAVRQHLDFAPDCVAELRAVGVDRQLVLAQFDDLDWEIAGDHFARTEVDRLLGGSVQREPGRGLEHDADILRRVQVVVEHDGDGYAVVLRQGHGQIDVHEEVLEHTDRGVHAAEGAVRGVGHGRHAPRGDAVRKRERQHGAPLRVGDQCRHEQQRLREILAHTHRSGTGRGTGRGRHCLREHAAHGHTVQLRHLRHRHRGEHLHAPLHGRFAHEKQVRAAAAESAHAATDRAPAPCQELPRPRGVRPDVVIRTLESVRPIGQNAEGAAPFLHIAEIEFVAPAPRVQEFVLAEQPLAEQRLQHILRRLPFVIQ